MSYQFATTAVRAVSESAAGFGARVRVGGRHSQAAAFRRSARGVAHQLVADERIDIRILEPGREQVAEHLGRCQVPRADPPTDANELDSQPLNLEGAGIPPDLPADCKPLRA